MRLNSKVIPNHGYVEINNIGFTNNTALHCNFNHYSLHSGVGGWIGPNGTEVSSYDTAPGFTTTRTSEFVRLLRKSGTPQEGIYQCVTENDTSIIHAVYVGLYNRGRGKLIIMKLMGA